MVFANNLFLFVVIYIILWLTSVTIRWILWKNNVLLQCIAYIQLNLLYKSHPAEHHKCWHESLLLRTYCACQNMAFRTTAVKLGENSANMYRWGLVIQRGLQRAKDSLKGTQSRWLLLEVVTYMRTCWIERDWIIVSGTFLLIKTQVKRIFFLLTLAKVKDKKFVLLTKLVQSRWWILAKFSFAILWTETQK